MPLPLPRDDDDAVDEGVLAEVDHPDGVLDVVVVEVGAIPEVGVQLSVNGERAVAVAPLLPRVTLVVDPCHLVEGLVGDWKCKQKPVLRHKRRKQMTFLSESECGFGKQQK